MNGGAVAATGGQSLEVGLEAQDTGSIAEAALVDAVERTLDEEIRPALGAHAGSIRFLGYRSNVVHLEMRASCSSCYFRRGCVVNLVRPTLEEAIGDDVQFVVDNVRA